MVVTNRLRSQKFAQNHSFHERWYKYIWYIWCKHLWWMGLPLLGRLPNFKAMDRNPATAIGHRIDLVAMGSHKPGIGRNIQVMELQTLKKTTFPSISSPFPSISYKMGPATNRYSNGVMKVIPPKKWPKINGF